MKNLVKWLFVIAVASLIAVPSLQAQGKSGKVKVYLVHNGHVISVAPEAVPAHLAHGDSYYDPAPTKYTVEVTFLFQEYDMDGNLRDVFIITASQTVDENGGYTFVGVFSGYDPWSTPTVIGTATVVRNGDDLVVSDVQSNVSVSASTVLF